MHMEANSETKPESGLVNLADVPLAEREKIREKVVAEARSWIGTPFHIGARVKGAGVDCGQLLYCVYHACGLIPEEEAGLFAGDWFCHTTEEKYQFRMFRHAYKIVEGKAYGSLAAKPGSAVLVKAAGSELYNHGGIVVHWPRVIHAGCEVVEEVDAMYDPLWSHNVVMNFDLWPEDGKGEQIEGPLEIGKLLRRRLGGKPQSGG
jgi:cell wall-associated NlpC family hydrolase